MDRQKLLIIVGPTASGKSDLAVSLAKKFNGEVISADSRQIYRNLAIGSGTVTKKEMAGIAHHLLGVISPRRVFTAAQFVARARRAIAAIARRGHVPIVAGGAAFWIDALVDGMALPEVEPDMALRRRLEKKSAAVLLAMLEKMDPRRAAGIEQKNPRRLIRAIEIARSLGAVPTLKKHFPYDALWIGIALPRGAWMRRVARRVGAMIRRGLIAETKKLISQGVGERRIREFGFEYTAALDAIVGAIPRRELAPRIIRHTARYARRQMQWWRRNGDIRWISVPADAVRITANWLRKSGSRAATTRTGRRSPTFALPPPPPPRLHPAFSD